MAIKYYGYTEDEVNAITDPVKQSSRDVVYAKEAFRLVHATAGYNAEAERAYDNLFQQYSLARDNRSDLPEPFALPVPAYAQILVAGADAWPFLTYSTTERVCATKTWAPAERPVLGEGKIGPRYYPDDDEFFYALDGDTTPNFKKIPGTSSDGVYGVFQKHANIQGSPVNTGGEIKGMFIRLKPQPLK